MTKSSRPFIEGRNQTWACLRPEVLKLKLHTVTRMQLQHNTTMTITLLRACTDIRAVFELKSTQTSQTSAKANYNVHQLYSDSNDSIIQQCSWHRRLQKVAQMTRIFKQKRHKGFRSAGGTMTLPIHVHCSVFTSLATQASFILFHFFQTRLTARYVIDYAIDFAA